MEGNRMTQPAPADEIRRFGLELLDFLVEGIRMEAQKKLAQIGAPSVEDGTIAHGYRTFRSPQGVLVLHLRVIYREDTATWRYRSHEIDRYPIGYPMTQEEVQVELPSGTNGPGPSDPGMRGVPGYVPTCPRCREQMTLPSRHGRLWCFNCGLIPVEEVTREN